MLNFLNGKPKIYKTLYKWLSKTTNKINKEKIRIYDDFILCIKFPKYVIWGKEISVTRQVWLNLKSWVNMVNASKYRLPKNSIIRAEKCQQTIISCSSNSYWWLLSGREILYANMDAFLLRLWRNGNNMQHDEYFKCKVTREKGDIFYVPTGENSDVIITSLQQQTIAKFDWFR